MNLAITRRDFLAASSCALATLAIDSNAAQAHAQRLPTGPVYGRVGGRGLRPGSADRPSFGEVVLLDGCTLEVRHEANRGIATGKSVWLSPSADGVYSVLYAEV